MSEADAATEIELQSLRQFLTDRPDALEVLTDRERIIVISRVSEAVHQRRTLLQLSREFNLSRERVRDIFRRALDKVRLFRERDLHKCPHCNGKGWLDAERP